MVLELFLKLVVELVLKLVLELVLTLVLVLVLEMVSTLVLSQLQILSLLSQLWPPRPIVQWPRPTGHCPKLAAAPITHRLAGSGGGCG